MVSDAIGCTGVSNSIYIEFLAASNIDEIRQVTVTPNPFTQRLRLEVTVSTPVFLEMCILDLRGKTILTDRLAVTSTVARDFDLGQIPSGIYLLVLKNGKGEWVERLVKL